MKIGVKKSQLILIVLQNILLLPRTQTQHKELINIVDSKKTEMREISDFEKKARQTHNRDRSELIDVIYLIQRAGTTKEDLNHIKEFLRSEIEDLPGLEQGSRIAVSYFTGISYQPITLSRCCNINGAEQAKGLINSLTFDSFVTDRIHDEKSHPGRQSDSADIKYAFQSIYEKYLSRGEARVRSTLIVFIANYIEYSSYSQLLDDGVEYIEACKNSGAGLVVIIVDPVPDRDIFTPEDMGLLLRNTQSRNRRKRQSKMTVSQRILADMRKYLKKDKQAQDVQDVVNKQNYLNNLLKRFKNLRREEKEPSLVRAIINKTPPLIPRGRMTAEVDISLTLLYAQSLASRPEYGFSIRNYASLNQSTIKSLLTGMLTDPTSWLGEGKVNSTCAQTFHMTDQAIWSPGYNQFLSYPPNINCSWLIQARRNHYVILRFTFFNSESGFDVLTAYNGKMRSENTLLAILTGFYNLDHLPVISSITENLFILFRTDGSRNYGGFHADWSTSPIRYVFRDTDVAFLIDVSGSIFNADLDAAKTWINKSLDYFFFKDEISPDDFSDIFDLERTLARIGLLSFGSETETLIENSQFVTKTFFLEELQKIRPTIEDTFAGKAIEYTTTRQLLSRNQEENYNPYDQNGHLNINRLINGRTKECNSQVLAPRILFLFTDGYFSDDPAVAAQQLCAHNILLVVISIGNYNLRSIAQLTDMCGIMVRVTLNIGDVMELVRCKLGLKYTMTSYVEILTTPPINATPATTRSTFPPKPEITPIIVYVQPNLYKFNYWGLAILLMTICGIEILFLGSLILFFCCLTPVAINHPEDVKQLLENNVQRQILFVNENERRLREVLNLPNAELEKPYPTNSFFTRHAVKTKKKLQVF